MAKSATMGSQEVIQFLSYLACEKKVAASTQNKELNAMLFLYRYVLNVEIEIGDKFVRAKKTKHIPAVFTKQERRCFVQFKRHLLVSGKFIILIRFKTFEMLEIKS